MNASLLQVHKDLEEAAYVSGARPWRMMWRVFLPLMMPTFVGIWIWVVLHAVRIAGLPLILYEGQENQVLAILIWNMWDEGYVPAVAAIGTLLMSTLLLLTLLVRYVGFRRQWIQPPVGMIRIKNLHVFYQTERGPVHAVRGIDVDIQQGQFFTLLGPSGCGKTTTLRSVAGLETPEQGRNFRRRRSGLFVDRQNFRAALRSRHRHGVSVLRDLAALERLRERGVSLARDETQASRASRYATRSRTPLRSSSSKAWPTAPRRF